MQHLIITLDNQKHTDLFLGFIRQFDFIKSVEITQPISMKKTKTKIDGISASKFKDWSEFESLLGIWEGRNITKESLREKAWRKA